MLCAPSATLCRSAWWKGLVYATPDIAVERRRSDSLGGERSRAPSCGAGALALGGGRLRLGYRLGGASSCGGHCAELSKRDNERPLPSRAWPDPEAAVAGVAVGHGLR